MPRPARRPITVLGFVALLVGGTILVAAPAHADNASTPANQTSALASMGITVSADGWITYRSALPQRVTLAGATTTTATGTVLSDGSCVIGGQDTASSTVQTYVEETGYNPLTCQARILSGTLPTTANSAATASTQSASAHTKTLYIDPLNITITSQAVNLKWPTNGAAGTPTTSTSTYTFPFDGWKTASKSNTGIVGVSNGWYVQQKVHFVNWDFATLVYTVMGPAGWVACGALLTNQADFYHQDRVTGYKTGSASYSWSDSVTGACSDLVHHASSNGSGTAS